MEALIYLLLFLLGLVVLIAWIFLPFIVSSGFRKMEERDRRIEERLGRMEEKLEEMVQGLLALLKRLQ